MESIDYRNMNGIVLFVKSVIWLSHLPFQCAPPLPFRSKLLEVPLYDTRLAPIQVASVDVLLRAILLL